MAYIAIAAMLAGTAVQAKARQQAAKRAESTRVAEFARQKKTAEQSRDSVLQNLREYDPTKRTQNQTAIEQNTAERLVSDTTKAAEETEALTPAAGGKVSSDYLQGRARSLRDTTNRASAMAGLLAKIRAPAKLREEEALKNADYGSREEILASLLRSRKATGDQLVGIAGTPDSGKMALGSLLQAAGSAYGMGAGAGAAGTTAQTAGSVGPGFWDMMGRGVRTMSPIP